MEVSQDLTSRFSSNRHGLYEIEANSLLGYQLSKTVGLWAGYDHDPQYSGAHFTVLEHRLVQQLTLSNIADLPGGQLSGRVRLEQRWRDGVAGTAWRLRPYVRYSLPLAGKSKTSLVVSEEPFIDLNTDGFQKVRGLERLRTFIGISTSAAKSLSADMGYLNQHGMVPGGKDTSDNVAYVLFRLKL